MANQAVVLSCSKKLPKKRLQHLLHPERSVTKNR